MHFFLGALRVNLLLRNRKTNYELMPIWRSVLLSKAEKMLKIFNGILNVVSIQNCEFSAKKCNGQTYPLTGICFIGKFSLPQNFVQGYQLYEIIQMHFANNFKYVLTKCLKEKLHKMYVIVLFCYINSKCHT